MERQEKSQTADEELKTIVWPF